MVTTKYRRTLVEVMFVYDSITVYVKFMLGIGEFSFNTSNTVQSKDMFNRSWGYIKNELQKKSC